MTIVINLQNGDEEKVLSTFLNNSTDEQQKEITKRDNDLVAGKTTVRSWDDIKKDLRDHLNK